MRWWGGGEVVMGGGGKRCKRYLRLARQYFGAYRRLNPNDELALRDGRSVAKGVTNLRADHDDVAGGDAALRFIRVDGDVVYNGLFVLVQREREGG